MSKIINDIFRENHFRDMKPESLGAALFLSHKHFPKPRGKT